ncbi:MAG: DoxX family protein [Sphingobium sp.]
MDGARRSDGTSRVSGRGRTVVRWLVALGYAFAGYKHVTAPAGFVAITPGWVPDAAMVVWVTGWCEMAGALGLLVPPALLRWPRPAAGIGLALYALCVWPANINHALNDIAIGGVHLGWWYHGPRLALQPVLIWVGLWVGGVVRPFGRRSGQGEQ